MHPTFARSFSGPSLDTRSQTSLPPPVSDVLDHAPTDASIKILMALTPGISVHIYRDEFQAFFVKGNKQVTECLINQDNGKCIIIMHTRKSVLLKSIRRRLQKEVEEAKLQKQQAPSNPWCYTPPGFTRDTPCEDGGVVSPLSVTNTGRSETSVLNDTPTFALTLDNKCLLKNDSSKKCPFDEVEDCDVLQQFYMPPTLCMLDEDNAVL
uniref:Uncharacterized protein n=1 Tax=Timema shepardi TaxID=629360 RepID=A0A7R9FXJ5_TIMSH|nr:unnamed protein product [Timema shepardi]